MASINLPGPAVAGLDSWATILVDAHLRGRQFGPEIAFTYGPWSFLCLGGYLPDALNAKFAWEIVGKFLLASTLVTLCWSLPPIRRWVFFVLVVCGAAFFDNLAQVAIAVLAVLWLTPSDARWWQRALAIVWLSFLAHFKFIFFAQAVVCMTVAALFHLSERRTRLALVLLGSFVVSYVLFWVAAGQRLENLPTFWRLSWEISSGYSWAMGLEPDRAALICGGIVAGACICLLWLVVRAKVELKYRLAVALLLLANWLLAWKLGFTRADGHVFGFFFLCLYLGMLVPAVCGSRRFPHWADINVAICIGAIALTSLPLLLHGPRVAWDHLKRFPYEITHLDGWTRRFMTAFEQHTKAMDDPELRAVVGMGTVDLINFEQHLLFYNRLNYRPRPIPQSYSAYTPELMKANSRFFGSDSAPEFVVLRINAIDGRYPGQEDALSLLGIARRYGVEYQTDRYVILRLLPVEPPLAEHRRETLAGYAAGFNKDVSLPVQGFEPLWVEIDIKPTFAGRLRALLYHASPPNMVATFPNGEEKKFRLITTTSSQGFIVRPFLESPADFASLITGPVVRSPLSIRIELDEPHHKWFWRPPLIRFYSVSDLPRYPGSS